VTIGGTHPFQSRAQLQTLYAQASCVAYPSWYEGFGIPLHEASVYGTPCISSTAGALPETAPPGTLFAPPQKPHLWVEALELVLQNPEAHKTTRALGDWTKGATHIAQTLSSL
jgi:glycosyltransferase involved in cell wall biosynthesis